MEFTEDINEANLCWTQSRDGKYIEANLPENERKDKK